MKTRNLPALPLVILAVLVGLSLWLSSLVQPGNGVNGEVTHLPDLIIEHFVAQKMGQTGVIQYTVKADRMRHFPDNDSAELEQVVLTMLTPDKPELSIAAPKGLLMKADEWVRLDGGVVVSAKSTASQEAIRMTTPALDIYPRQNRAVSNQGAVIENGRTRLTAEKVEMNSQTRIISMARVRGQWEAPK